VKLTPRTAWPTRSNSMAGTAPAIRPSCGVRRTAGATEQKWGSFPDEADGPVDPY
jgi:hypothetical protein